VSALLRAYRRAQAKTYADDVLLLANRPAREVAERNRLPLTVVLRVLVPHYTAKGANAREIADQLGVSERTVVRHRRAG
jgi:DNA-binding NarL/FixJ family response regulator